MDASRLQFIQLPGTQAGADAYRFVPCFQVTTMSGQTVCMVSISLTQTAATMATGRLADQDSADEVLQQALLRYAGRHDDLVRDLAVLGIAWPPTDWGAAWEQVRGEAAATLSLLRDETRMVAQRAA
jgi:hypothetical protein